MLFLAMGVILAAYILAIGMTLKCAHRLCQRANNHISASKASLAARSTWAALAATIPLAMAMAVTAVFAWATTGRPVQVLGLTYGRHSLPYMGWGATVGFVCVMLMFVCGIMGGFIKVKSAATTSQRREHLPMFLGGLSDYFSGAVLEEVVTRGFIFYLLHRTFGGVAAIIGSSLIFSLVHLIRPDRIPLIFTLNAFIFGLLTGACRLSTGGLWLPIGLHFGWNVTAGPFLGLPYSGIVYDKGVVCSDVSGPEWFTGGFYSPDAGVLGTFALLVAAIGLRLIAPVI